MATTTENVKSATTNEDDVKTAAGEKSIPAQKLLSNRLTSQCQSTTGL